MKLLASILKAIYKILRELIVDCFFLSGTAFFLISTVKMFVWINWWWAIP